MKHDHPLNYFLLPVTDAERRSLHRLIDVMRGTDEEPLSADERAVARRVIERCKPILVAACERQIDQLMERLLGR